MLGANHTNTQETTPTRARMGNYDAILTTTHQRSHKKTISTRLPYIYIYISRKTTKRAPGRLAN